MVFMLFTEKLSVLKETLTFYKHEKQQLRKCSVYFCHKFAYVSTGIID